MDAVIGRFVLHVCASSLVVFPLVVVNSPVILGTGDSAWPISGSREAPAFVLIGLVRRGLGLIVNAYQSVRLKLGYEALLFHAVLASLGGGAYLRATDHVDVLEEVTDHGMCVLGVAALLVLHDLQRHRREDLGLLPVIVGRVAVGATRVRVRVALLVFRRSVMWTNIF